METRGLSKEHVLSVCEKPNQQWKESSEKLVCQSRFEDDQGQLMLLRVFVNIGKAPNLIITAYKTSRITKYWKPS